MRSIFLSLFILPLIASSQINRSAKELAGETIKDYITNKLFKGRSYHPISFGELKSREEENREVIWTYSHKFEITENKNDTVARTYNFTFYLDRKMKVLRADGAFMR